MQMPCCLHNRLEHLQIWVAGGGSRIFKGWLHFEGGVGKGWGELNTGFRNSWGNGQWSDHSRKILCLHNGEKIKEGFQGQHRTLTHLSTIRRSCHPDLAETAREKPLASLPHLLFSLLKNLWWVQHSVFQARASSQESPQTSICRIHMWRNGRAARPGKGQKVQTNLAKIWSLWWPSISMWDRREIHMFPVNSKF